MDLVSNACNGQAPRVFDLIVKFHAVIVLRHIVHDHPAREAMIVKVAIDLVRQLTEHIAHGRGGCLGVQCWPRAELKIPLQHGCVGPAGEQQPISINYHVALRVRGELGDSDNERARTGWSAKARMVRAASAISPNV